MIGHPFAIVLVEPMEGLPSFCLSRLSHRRSSTFKTSLVSDTIVSKGSGFTTVNEGKTEVELDRSPYQTEATLCLLPFN